MWYNIIIGKSLVEIETVSHGPLGIKLPQAGSREGA